MDCSSLLKALSIEEKAKLCVGMNFWMTQDYPEKGVPSLFLSDGPHGLRKQDVKNSDHLGINESHPSVCYPTACAAACTWDRGLLEEMGDTLGREAFQSGVDILLGPGVNIKRSALCGRNFEYYSEDPYLAGELASSFVRGIQKNPVSACVKHFAANSQENRRKAINAVMDERTLREIYLPAFEACVTKGKIHSAMTSYNKINGKYTAQNPHISTDILRKTWGFDGLLMTDWGGMDKIIPSIQAGLSLQMPGDDGSSAAKIIKAVNEGQLSEAELDAAVLGILNVIAWRESMPQPLPVSAEECHEMAVKVAREAIVLLKNEESLLPLSKEEKLAVIGQMAVRPRYQGAGSSHVNPYRLSTVLEEMQLVSGNISYAQGYDGAETTEVLLEEAEKLARENDKVVLFIGLPDSYESETYDRASIEMPAAYVRLVSRLVEANKNLIVVLSNGSVVSLPFAGKVKAIVEAYLAGEGSGKAISDVLFGLVNPSGKLAETFIKRIEDSPVFIGMTDDSDISDRCEYREGVFVGYRYYEKKAIEPEFCFGHGLSYTQFEYSNLKIDREEIEDTETVTVSVDVRNVGSCFGKEAVQLYVGRDTSPVPAPKKELKEFAKVPLEPGEKKTVSFSLDKRAFAYFNEALDDWYVPDSTYTIYVGSSSLDIRCEAKVRVYPAKPWAPPATRNTVLRDILERKEWFEIFQEKYVEIKPYLPFGLSKLDIKTDPFARGLLNNMTLNSLASYVGAHLSDEDIQTLVDKFNSV